jgi:hypothetical protein
MLHRTHNTSETYSLSPSMPWPSSTGAKPACPCARKDDRSFFTLHIKQLFGNTDDNEGSS